MPTRPTRTTSKNTPRSGPDVESPLVGVYPATVQSVNDPEGRGRVRVRVRIASEQAGRRAPRVWARLATMMAGDDRGTWFVPERGDEVLVVFERGDVRAPYVIGALWSSEDTPPETITAGKNRFKTIRTRSGVTIRIDDQADRPSLRLQTPAGQSVELDDDAERITIEDPHGNSIVLDANGVTVTSSAKLEVSASAVEISAGSVTVNAGVSRFNGIVQADTVIANSVESDTYTPGAGNIL